MQKIAWCNLTIEQPVGVYKITNVINSKVYIGSSINLSSRISDHYYRLRTKTHKNIHLQNAWGKYKEENFSVEILEYSNLESVLVREQYYLDVILFAQEYIGILDQRLLKLGYNTTPTAEAPRNIKRSEAYKNNISLKAQARWGRMDETTRSELKIKFKLAKLGKLAPHNYKKVKVINNQTNEVLVFNSVKGTADHYSIHPSHLSKTLSRGYSIKMFKHLRFTYEN